MPLPIQLPPPEMTPPISPEDLAEYARLLEGGSPASDGQVYAMERDARRAGRQVKRSLKKHHPGLTEGGVWIVITVWHDDEADGFRFAVSRQEAK